MFGIGGSELLVILVVALLFLGPDKLPSAAKTISKGIRDLKKQSRALQSQIESDEQIGGAIRDLKSALRGEEVPAARSIRPPPRPIGDKANPAITGAITGPAVDQLTGGDGLGEAKPELADAPPAEAPALTEAEEPKLTLPATAGEADGPTPSADDDAELASLVKPASGTVAKGS
jgi:sec-independent protein translocase protein TatB